MDVCVYVSVCLYRHISETAEANAATFHLLIASIKVTLLVQSKYFSKNHISKTTAAIELIPVPIFC